MSTFELIETLQPTNEPTSISFSGIPNTFKSLIVVGSIKLNANSFGKIGMTVNGDTGSNYATSVMWSNLSAQGNDSGADGSNRIEILEDNLFQGNNDVANFVLDIGNYSDTSKYTNFIYEAMKAGDETDRDRNIRAAAVWENTANLTTITFFESNYGYTFRDGTVISIYGLEG